MALHRPSLFRQGICVEEIADRDMDRDLGDLTASSESLSDLRSMIRDTGSARSTRVNRTHRVVRQRAKSLAERRSKLRSLWLPLVIFSSLLVGVCVAAWTLLDEYDLAAAGTQVSSYQVLVPLLWSIPISASLLAVIWFRQPRGETGRGPVE
jgi:hypothetical protein